MSETGQFGSALKYMDEVTICEVSNPVSVVLSAIYVIRIRLNIIFDVVIDVCDSIRE